MNGSHTVILIGAGGHASVLIDALAQRNTVIAGLADADKAKHARKVYGLPVLGDDSILERYPSEMTQLVNALGSTETTKARQAVFQRLRARGYRFLTVIHPSAIVAPDVVLGEGAQVMAGAIIQPGTAIGDNSLINTGAQVDHDCSIGPHVHVAPGATLSGDVSVGAATHIGAGATVIQGVRIGDNCLIAAGSVVVADVPDGSRVAGVPARHMQA